MINEKKAMLDFVNAAAKLNFRQLIVAQAQLSEHIFNCYQNAELMKLKRDEQETLKQANTNAKGH